jgi:hypothetical protein
MIDGVGLASIGKPLAVLGAWGAMGFGVGLRMFRWA